MCKPQICLSVTTLQWPKSTFLPNALCSLMTALHYDQMLSFVLVDDNIHYDQSPHSLLLFKSHTIASNSSHNKTMCTSYYLLSSILICLSIGEAIDYDPLPLEIIDETTLFYSREDRTSVDYCYKEHVLLLEKNCVDLNSDQKSRLALKLANCHFVENGKPPYPCPEDAPLPNCTG